MSNTTKKQKCSICEKAFIGYGHNAEPINDGRCCNYCNDKVINERIRKMGVKK